ncbi:DUF4232 domain-containing protein [Nocardioides gilvus]|uniref:DUF4232 domain-containing protein n=1 Tax=Nocardioides gilvus TaxID=1735589 RepID=UPI000D74EB60|nr:DUF4232 domain-containing protein [Nocardioides gilvus]
MRLLPFHALTAALTGAVLALSACGADESPAAESTPTVSEPPTTAGAPDESELAPGWDEAPDGPAPTADADLSDAALKKLLRTRSSAGNSADSCGPDDVTAQLSGIDVALGHRYTSLVVKNTSSRPCVVDAVAGVGARGEWGNRFTLTVQPGSSISGASGASVRLAPGGEAGALMEWTGELAGHDAEKASMLVVQLAPGQVPVRVAARLNDVPDEESALDIGMLTTIKLGPFEPRS